MRASLTASIRPCRVARNPDAVASAKEMAASPKAKMAASYKNSHYPHDLDFSYHTSQHHPSFGNGSWLCVIMRPRCLWEVKRWLRTTTYGDGETRDDGSNARGGGP